MTVPLRYFPVWLCLSSWQFETASCPSGPCSSSQFAPSTRTRGPSWTSTSWWISEICRNHHLAHLQTLSRIKCSRFEWKEICPGNKYVEEIYTGDTARSQHRHQLEEASSQGRFKHLIFIAVVIKYWELWKLIVLLLTKAFKLKFKIHTKAELGPNIQDRTRTWLLRVSSTTPSMLGKDKRALHKMLLRSRDKEGTVTRDDP